MGSSCSIGSFATSRVSTTSQTRYRVTKRFSTHFSYVSTCISLLSLPTEILEDQERNFYHQEMLTVSQSLTSPANFDLSSLFTAQLSIPQSRVRLGDAIEITCTFTSRLPQEFPVDRVLLRMSSATDSEMTLEAPGMTLPKEGATVTLRQIATKPGTFDYSKLTIELGLLSLSRSLKGEYPQELTVVREPSTMTFGVTHSTGVQVESQLTSDQLLWGVPQLIAVNVNTHEDQFSNGIISLWLPSSVSLITEGKVKIQSSTGSEREGQVDGSQIHIGGAKSQETLTILLPLTFGNPPYDLSQAPTDPVEVSIHSTDLRCHCLSNIRSH